MRPILATAGSLLAAAIALYPLTIAWATPIALLALFSAVLLAGSVVTARWVPFGVGMSFFATEYAVALLLGEARLDLGAPFVGVACLVLFELVDMSGLAREHEGSERELLRRRLHQGLRLSAAGGLAGGLVLVVGAFTPGGHPVVLIIGAAGGLGALGICVYLVVEIVRPERV